MIPVKTKLLSKAFDLPLPIFIASLVVGVGIITTTGLLSGLVARPGNCIKADVPATSPTTTAATTRPTTTTTQAAQQTTTTTQAAQQTTTTQAAQQSTTTTQGQGGQTTTTSRPAAQTTTTTQGQGGQTTTTTRQQTTTTTQVAQQSTFTTQGQGGQTTTTSRPAGQTTTTTQGQGQTTTTTQGQGQTTTTTRQQTTTTTQGQQQSTTTTQGQGQTTTTTRQQTTTTTQGQGQSTTTTTQGQAQSTTTTRAPGQSTTTTGQQAQSTTTTAGQGQSTTTTTRGQQSSTTTAAGSTATTRETVSLTLPTTTLRTLPTVTTNTPLTTRTTLPPTQFRLLKSLAPTLYKLLLQFDFEPFDTVPEGTELQYTGNVKITFNVVEATNEIVFHLDRNVQLVGGTNIAITNEDNDDIQVTSADYRTNQLFEIKTSQELKKNVAHTIEFNFRAKSTEDGLYFHSYTENAGRRSLIATRFLPTLARTAFPCFDEPSFKAKFDITIEHPERTIAVSNFPGLTPETFNVNGKNKLRTRFEQTYAMSTYSVGFAVIPEDFASKTLPDDDAPTKVTIHGRKSEIEDEGLGDFALEVAGKVLTYLATYTGNTDALPPKIDLIALPFFPDFSSPSWGLNGFREDDLFYKDTINSRTDKQLVALTVAKEMAHNWFGNYLTTAFWDDRWLDEGMATLFAYKAVQDAYPEFDVENQFLSDHTVPIQWQDGFESTIPIKYIIDSNTEIKFLFSKLLVSKSAALMRMFESIYTPADFKAAVQKYLESHPYFVTNPNYFFNIFPAPSGWPISSKEFLEPWLVQRNYPEVSVIPRVVSGKTRVDFVQARFLLSEIDEEDGVEGLPKDYFWPIYLQCKAGGNATSPIAEDPVEFSLLLNNKTGSIDLGKRYGWVKCNKDFRGYYYTAYSTSLYNQFEEVLLRTELFDTWFSTADRTNLIHVAFEGAYLGINSYYVPSLLSNYLETNENKITPWKTFTYHINKIATITEHRASFSSLRGFIIRLISEAVDRFSYDLWADSASHQEELIKLDFIELLCRMQDVACLNKATELFKTIPGAYFLDPPRPNPVSVNLRPIVYKYHLQNTYRYKDWFELLSFYSITNDEREREYTLEALANTRSTWQFDFLLNSTLDALGKIKLEDVPLFLSALGINPTGRYFAWYYIRENWGLYFLKGADMRKLTFAVRDITDSFDDPFLLQEIIEFFKTTYDFDNIDIRAQTLDIVLNNIIWANTNEIDFLRFFSV